VTLDDQVRVLAIAAAFSLLTMQHWPWAIGRAFDGLAAFSLWVHDHWLALSRVAAAGLIVAAAWGTLPIPRFRGGSVSVSVTVPEPDAEMRGVVEPVRSALRGLPPASRDLWAATWSKAAIVVESEAGSSVSVFKDTATLRQFTVIALDVAWRRIGGNAPGSVDGLRDAVETAMRTALGLDEVPATPAVRERYVRVARAIAWAGTGG
jgi:hypothetical protein